MRYSPIFLMLLVAMASACQKQKDSPSLFDTPLQLQPLPGLSQNEEQPFVISSNPKEEELPTLENLGLSDLIDIALRHNPATQKSWWHARRAVAALGLAESTNYPDLSAEAYATRAREVKFPNGPNTTFTWYETDLCLSYLLFDFGERRATVKAAKDALLAANWVADWEIQKIVSTVATHYYEYLNAKEVLKSRKTSYKDAQGIFSAAEELHKAGLCPITDLYTSKTSLSQMQIEIAQQKAHVAIALGRLTSSLGLDIETKIKVAPLPDDIQNTIPAEGLSKLISIAQEKRADILAKQAIVAEKEALVTKESRASFPKLRAVADGGWNQYSKHQGSGYNYNGTLNLSIPLFKGFEYTYRKRLALADAEGTQAELKELQLDVALEILTYSELLKAAEEVLKSSCEYLENALKTYEGTLENYRCGTKNIFDLITSQQALAEARIKTTNARAQWYVSLSELAYATGTLVTHF